MQREPGTPPCKRRRGAKIVGSTQKVLRRSCQPHFSMHQVSFSEGTGPLATKKLLLHLRARLLARHLAPLPELGDRCLQCDAVDGRNLAPPKKPCNDDFHVDTRQQTMVSHNFKVVQDFVHPHYEQSDCSYFGRACQSKHDLGQSTRCACDCVSKCWPAKLIWMCAGPSQLHVSTRRASSSLKLD